jgi:hypothetical protein
LRDPEAPRTWNTPDSHGVSVDSSYSLIKAERIVDLLVVLAVSTALSHHLIISESMMIIEDGGNSQFEDSPANRVRTYTAYTP